MSVWPRTGPLDVYEAKHLHVCSNVFSNNLTTCCSATSLQTGIAPSWWAVVFDLCGLFPTLLSVTKSKEHCLEGKRWALITGCCNRRQVVAAVGEVMIANGSIKGAKQGGKKIWPYEDKRGDSAKENKRSTQLIHKLSMWLAKSSWPGELQRRLFHGRCFF